MITGLKEDATYELVIKATNQIGTSMLTDPLKFSTAEKYITSAASLGGKVDIFFCHRVKLTFKLVGKLERDNLS